MSVSKGEDKKTGPEATMSVSNGEDKKTGPAEATGTEPPAEVSAGLDGILKGVDTVLEYTPLENGPSILMIVIIGVVILMTWLNNDKDDIRDDVADYALGPFMKSLVFGLFIYVLGRKTKTNPYVTVALAIFTMIMMLWFEGQRRGKEKD